MVLVSEDFLIVIADDDPDDKQFIEQALKRNNYGGYCKGVDDGQKLINLLNELPADGRPGLILLDLNMPLKDGYETLAEIKSQPAFKDIPVAVITSSLRKTDEAKCYSLGCSKFFRKPFSIAGYDQMASEVLGYLARR